MPQPTNLCNKSKKKVAASNGRIPAFNNTFAFRHNPKSKKTAHILASPIQYCCRRCHDKIVWRKTYRKYKPLTQPTTCNLCSKRNITAAYHTVCDTCSVTHPKAMALLHEWNQNKQSSPMVHNNSNSIPSASSDTVSDQVEELTMSLESPTMAMVDVEVSPSHQQLDDAVATTTASTRRNHLIHKRVCTVCFKQPALPDENTGDYNDDDDDNDDEANHRPLKLRQVKSLQRQREKQQQEEQGRKKKPPSTSITTEENNTDHNNNIDDDSEGNHDDDDDDDDDDDAEYDEEDEEDEDEHAERSDDHNICSERYSTQSTPATSTLDFTNDDEMNDPFLQAIGGAQNLLVGEAYQKKMMEKNTK